MHERRRKGWSRIFESPEPVDRFCGAWLLLLTARTAVECRCVLGGIGVQIIVSPFSIEHPAGSISFEGERSTRGVGKTTTGTHVG